MRKNPYEAIATERARQDEMWGGPQHDDGRTRWDWAAIIAVQAEKAMVLVQAEEMLGVAHDSDAFQRRMTIIGALAVAALESTGRNAAREETRRTAQEPLRFDEQGVAHPHPSPRERWAKVPNIRNLVVQLRQQGASEDAIDGVLACWQAASSFLLDIERRRA